MAKKYLTLVCMHVCSVAQLCLTFCDPKDCSPPCSSVHGILQERILEWVAMPSSRGSSQPRNRTRISSMAGASFATEPLGKPLTQVYLTAKPVLFTAVLYSISHASGRRPTGTPIHSPRVSSSTCRPQRMNRPDFLLLLLSDSVVWESHSSSQILNPLLCRVEDTIPPLSAWDGIIYNILHSIFMMGIAAGRRQAYGVRRQQQERENK